MLFARGTNGDFNVLTEGREKFHETPDGKVARAVSHQQRDLGLMYAEDPGDFGLCLTARFEERMDLQGKLRLEQILLGIG